MPTRTIALTQGKETIVDEADYAWLSQWKWMYGDSQGDGRQGYARRGRYSEGRQTHVYMHRLIVDAPPGSEVDHINGNTLDNRRSNLRIVTAKENSNNRAKYRRNRGNPPTSQYKGVTRRPGRIKRPWEAQIGCNGERIKLGMFATEIEAAEAYDEAARRLFGEFARTNFPGGGK